MSKLRSIFSVKGAAKRGLRLTRKWRSAARRVTKNASGYQPLYLEIADVFRRGHECRVNSSLCMRDAERAA